jgi:hypothetical protein
MQTYKELIISIYIRALNIFISQTKFKPLMHATKFETIVYDCIVKKIQIDRISHFPKLS